MESTSSPLNFPLKIYGARFIDVTIHIRNWCFSDLFWLKQLQLHAPNLYNGASKLRKITIEITLQTNEERPTPIRNPGVSDLLLVAAGGHTKGRGVIYIELERIPNMSPLDYSFYLADYISNLN